MSVATSYDITYDIAVSFNYISLCCCQLQQCFIKLHPVAQYFSLYFCQLQHCVIILLQLI